jgi:hypothetical protein
MNSTNGVTALIMLSGYVIFIIKNLKAHIVNIVASMYPQDVRDFIEYLDELR